MLDRRLVILALTAIVTIVLFMTINVRGNWQFAMELRLERLLSLLQVSVSVALSTLVFQTITANRILTPSIMGMDALYVLLQTALVFVLGGFGYAALNPVGKFTIEVVMMAGLACLLFLPLLRYSNALVLMLLGGIVVGVLFRSLSSLLSRLIDPNDFAIVQNVSYADFNTVNADLLLPCLVLTIIAAAICWRARHVLDVILLGRPTAIGLGVNWRGYSVILLLLVGMLVAISTALAGPITFLGLLVVALGQRLAGTSKHSQTIITSILVAIILLVGGQTVLSHAFSNALPLGVLIEFIGGITFLFILFYRGQT
ncbi:iron chelate uptake ABC transporter family permease subunit [Ahrensia sp. 13_GOM-1096m]|uniref:iron chelate uptake ABC transporter family permease subunit n=1 Tax=Ahrensia sp. 13_GOM-1096m TaxID=1380380 RepID=UPI00047A0FD4|nr:iron chelate uptake ABC transporter family permease subunit [Ahrensia sp. 13_GOM-1096m]